MRRIGGLKNNNGIIRFVLAVAMACGFIGAHAAESASQAASPYISDIHMVDTHDGWAWSRGPESQRLLRTTDGAQTWTDVSPGPYGYAIPESCFFDSKIAWVSVWNPTNYHCRLFHTVNGGKTWTLLAGTNSPVYTEKSYCRFFSSTYGVAETSDCGAGSSYDNYYETHDGGNTWKPAELLPRYPDHNPGTPPAFVGVASPPSSFPSSPTEYNTHVPSAFSR